MLVRVNKSRQLTNVETGAGVDVNENEYALLNLIAVKSTLTKAEVVEHVWGCRGIIVTDSSYYQLLHSLRGKLRAISLDNVVRTLPRRGLQAFFRVELLDAMPIPINDWEVAELP